MKARSRELARELTTNKESDVFPQPELLATTGAGRQVHRLENPRDNEIGKRDCGDAVGVR